MSLTFLHLNQTQMKTNTSTLLLWGWNLKAFKALSLVGQGRGTRRTGARLTVGPHCGTWHLRRT